MDDVEIDPRVEPKPVLAGKILAAACPGAGQGLRAPLAAPRGPRLVDVDGESTLDQLVCRREPANAATDHDRAWCHHPRASYGRAAAAANYNPRIVAAGAP